METVNVERGWVTDISGTIFHQELVDWHKVRFNFTRDRTGHGDCKYLER